MSTTTPTSTAPARTGRGILLSVATGGILAAIINVVIGFAAKAAGADTHVGGMAVPPEIVFSIVGVLIGAVGWSIVRRAAKRPGRVLSVLVPVVFVITLIPDLGLGAQSGTGAVWTAVVGLIFMHVVTIAIAIPVYRRFLPLAR